MSEAKPTPDDRKVDEAGRKPVAKPTGQVDDNKDDLGRDINSRSDTRNPVNNEEPRRQP